MKQTNLISKNLWTFIIILFLIGLVTGIIGFMQEGQCFLCSIYTAIQTFALHHEFKDGIATGLLDYSRWILFFAFVGATFKLFFILIAPKWLQSQIRHLPCFTQSCLFAGAGEQAKILAKDIKEKSSCRCIFLVSKEKENDNALYDELRDIGAIILYVNFEDDKMKFPKKIDKFFFIEEDEQFNMEMSVRLLKKPPTKWQEWMNILKKWMNILITLFEKLKKKFPAKEKNIYVRTESKQFYSYIGNELEANSEQYKNIEFHIFNQSDLTARLFVKENPMLNSPKIKIDPKNLHVEGEFNVLLLGFGWQGQELLKKCVCDSQFVGSTFKATIIDSDFETHHGDYPVLYDECIEHYNLDFKSDTVGSKKFYEWLDAEIDKFNRIIIALGNDEFNINTAEKITEILHKHGTLNTKEIVFACVLRLEHYSRDFTTFGKLTEIYTEEMIVNAEMDIIAKQMHFGWVDKNKYPTIERAWFHDGSDLLWNHDSSRASAMGIGNILRLLEMKSIKQSEIKDNVVVSEEEFRDFIKPYIDILAENEHKRWNAYHFTKGIRLWKLSNVTYNELIKSDMKANQIKEYNRHAALIDFDQLTGLDKIINNARDKWNMAHPDKEPKKHENFQQKDRDSVMIIPTSLHQAKYVIIKN